MSLFQTLPGLSLFPWKYIYREMTEQMVLGEHIEETECILLDFCSSYVEASNNPDYQYA